MTRMIRVLRLGSPVVIVPSLFFLALLLVGHGQTWLKPADDVATVTCEIIATLMCIAGLWHPRIKAAPDDMTAVLALHTQRRVVIFFALALGGYTIGDALWAWYEIVLHRLSPSPSLADLFYLSSYPLFGAGILLLTRRRLAGMTRARIMLDSLMLITAAVTFSWYYLLGPTVLQAGENLAAKLVNTAYPFMDLVLVAAILLLRGAAVNPALRALSLMLACSFALIVATDALYGYKSLQGTFVTGELVDVGWPVGYLLVGLTAFATRQLVLPTVSIQRTEISEVVVPKLWRTALPYLTVPAVGILLVVDSGGSPILSGGVKVGAGVLMSLVILRQVLALRETLTQARILQEHAITLEALNTELRTTLANNDALTTANAQLATANTQLEVLATTDPMTGLDNRSRLRERIGAALMIRPTPTLALILLDLDRFKEVNDTLGHQYGDLLLQRIGPRLREAVRLEDTVARLGGDEFAILLPGADEKGASVVARALLSALAEPFDLEGHAIDVGASIGIALCPDHGADATTLLRQADVAMYTAKRGRLGCAVYVAAQDHHTPHRLALMGELRQAIDSDALVLHYQPQVTMKSGLIRSVEALIRWPHPTRGLVPPDEFIPLAENTGLIAPLTRWVLDTALRQSQAWEAAGIEMGLAMNISAHTLHDPELRSLIKDALQRYSVPAERLTLEITESALMLDPARAATTLDDLRELGVRLAIDDFGTGYSSLGYLKDLPVHEVKIDKSFVLGMHTGGDTGTLKNVTIVRSIVALAHALGLEVVAEGIETKEIWDALSSLRTDTAQGYLLARPLTAYEVVKWVQDSPAGRHQASA